VNWNEKGYLDTKSSLINKLGDIKTQASANYLKDLYYALDDTVQLQYPILESLLQHKTQYAYNLFRGIINNEPPVLEYNVTDYSSYRMQNMMAMYHSDYQYDDGKFMDELSDSLKLTKTILPDLLPLLNLQDYKTTMMTLLGKMVDSNLVKPQDYEMYFSKFLIEAKQELKKQSIAEKKKSIEKAEEDKTEKKVPSYYGDNDDSDEGNDDLSLYATLLLPFWETNPSVQPLIQQMLKSNDKRLKYNTMLLLMEKGKPYPDTLLKYFAGMDEYRYELYSDLKEHGKLDKFPSLYNNHLDLGRSALLDRKSGSKPDSLVYADRVKTTYKGKTGYIYFFKYKTKKDDLSWKLASVGLVPENPKEFEFNDNGESGNSPAAYSEYDYGEYSQYDFTEFKDMKLKDTESLATQLQKELKKMLYSKRKSAKQFYEDSGDRTRETQDIID
jgi:hypothetical protein